MKLKEYFDTYYEFSGLASSTSRSLAIAGIAIIWLFSSDGGSSSYSLPKELLSPTLFLTVTLACDLFQYVVATIIWRHIAMKFEAENQKEKEENNENEKEEKEKDFSHSKWLELPIHTLFVIKIITVLAAYLLLIKYMSSNIHFT